MSNQANYYAQKVIPCECGSREPYWHGPKDGLREYCCDACWARTQEANHKRPVARKRSRARKVG